MTVPKRFDFLRFISALLKVFAWIVLILSILGAISTALFSSQMGSLLGDQLGEYGWLFGGVGAILSAIFVLFFGFLYFALLFALGESIALNLAVEENTRMTARSTRAPPIRVASPANLSLSSKLVEIDLTMAHGYAFGEANGKHHRDKRTATGADERQRQPGDGHEAQIETHVDQHLKEDQGSHACGQ